MILLTFRIRRPQSIGAITKKWSGLEFHTWCNLETDFVQVLSRDKAATQSAMQAITARYGPNIIPIPSGGDRGAAALVPCPVDPATSVSLMVERHGGLVQPPIVSSAGWDVFRVVMFESKAVAGLLGSLQRLGECELVSKRPAKQFGSNGFYVPSAELLGRLTRRQAEALVAAAGLGYYREPRATNLAKVADTVGLGRASLEEHLRKAENKVLNALVPFVSTFAANLGATRSRGRSFARINRRHDHAVAKPAPAHAQRRSR